MTQDHRRSLERRRGTPAAWLTLLLVGSASAAYAQVITEFPIPTASSGPRRITVGPDGNLWFLERNANKVGRITTAGAIAEFAIPTAGGLLGSDRLAPGPDGNVWFGESAAGKISKVTPAGVITEFTVPTSPPLDLRLGAGPDGNVWFAENGTPNKLGKITPAGVITEFTVPTAGSFIADGAVGSDGNLWFTEIGNDKIARVTPAGVITEFSTPTAGSGATGMAAGPDGNLWFVEQTASKIGRSTTAGVITEFATPTPNSGPAFVGPGPDGNLWVLEFAVNTFVRINTAGPTFTEVVPVPALNFANLSGIADGPDGNFWLTDPVSNQIDRGTTAGSVTSFAVPTAGSIAADIAAGPDGNLWFVERGRNKIGRITTGPLFDLGLTVDAAGNGVFQPGETVTVAPTWKNNGASSISRSGTASNFTGPAGPTYTITDATAAYGTIAAGGSVNCAASGDCYGLSVTGTRPAQHWDTTFHETMSDGTEKIWTLHIGDSFTDVSPGGFYRFIETIFHKGVTGGCGGTNYCPTSNVTRQQMAVFLLVSKEGSSYSPPACTVPVFADVPCSSGFARWVNELSARGITGGCGGGNYCPTNPATRAQMAVFLLRTKEGPSYTPPACTTPMFADVPCSSGFAPWINELANRGITGGCGGGNYCPNSANTRGQMAVFLTTTFALQLYAK